MIAHYFHQQKYRAEGPNHLWFIDIKNKQDHSVLEFMDVSVGITERCYG